MVKRTVVGAHYGLRDWLVQRVSAVLIAVYSPGFITLCLAYSHRYSDWKGLFAHGWMRISTLVVAVALALHAWVGIRDVLMDYVRATGQRLFLQILAILVLAAYVAWVCQILWRSA